MRNILDIVIILKVSIDFVGGLRTYTEVSGYEIRKNTQDLMQFDVQSKI